MTKKHEFWKTKGRSGKNHLLPSLHSPGPEAACRLRHGLNKHCIAPCAQAEKGGRELCPASCTQSRPSRKRAARPRHYSLHRVTAETGLLTARSDRIREMASLAAPPGEQASQRPVLSRRHEIPGMLSVMGHKDRHPVVE
jgi:hypothetical protein